MNAYDADGVGCTSFSFGGLAGVYYPEVSERLVEWPRDWQLTFRGVLGKTLRQPFFHPYRSIDSTVDEKFRDRPDVWYVLEDGSNLDEVCADAVGTVLSEGLPFIERVGDVSAAIRSLDTDRWTKAEFGELGVLALAGIGSPAWQRTRDALVALEARARETTR